MESSRSLSLLGSRANPPYSTGDSTSYLSVRAADTVGGFCVRGQDGELHRAVGLSEDTVVEVHVVVHHALGREMSFGVSACGTAIEATHLMHGRHGASHIARGHQEPTHAIVDQLWHRATPKRDYWCSCCHRFDNRQPEGLFERDQVQQGLRASQQRVPLSGSNRAHEADLMT